MGTTSPNTSLLDASKGTTSDKTPAKLSGTSSAIAFAFQGVQPPSLLYVDVDDQLILQAASSQTAEVVTVNVRLLLPNGRLEDMQFPIRPANTRTVLRQSFALAQGYILSVSAVAAVAATRGQTFLRVATQRSASGAGNPAQMLFADYVTTQATSAYPNGRILAPTEGPGLVQAFTVANPAAGVDWSQTVPVNSRWRVRSWNATFTASAAAGNRSVAALLSGPAGALWQLSALVNVIASSVTLFSAGGIVPYTGINTSLLGLPLPPDLILTGSSLIPTVLGTQTFGILAGDQWSAIHLLIEEWLDNV
jgi:hypothetical protein